MPKRISREEGRTHKLNQAIRELQRPRETTDIEDAAITTDKIADASVTADKIDPGAIQSLAPFYIGSFKGKLGFTPSTAEQTIKTIEASVTLGASKEAFVFLSAKMKAKISGTRKRTITVFANIGSQFLAKVVLTYKINRYRTANKATAIVFTNGAVALTGALTLTCLTDSGVTAADSDTEFGLFLSIPDGQ